METKNPKKSPKYFSCDFCHYNTCNSKDYNKHLNTRKHKCFQNGNKMETKNPQTTEIFECTCGKMYKTRSGLWKHMKSCNNNSQTDLIIKIIKDNSEVMTKLLKDNSELQTTIKELVKNGITNNSFNNNNNNNKTFNLQIFLNETCKNAMNLSEFVSSITPTIEDLERTGRIGYVDGITKIMTNKLNDIKETERPIHCSDEKREVLYIKENNIWNKELEEKPILTKAIKQVAHKKIIEWKELHPECNDPNSKINDIYLKIVSNSMSGLTQEESDKNYKKIISNVSKNVLIDKSLSLLP